MSEQTSKHGPERDEQLKHETRGLVSGNRPSRVEEFRDPEPAGEDQDLADRGTQPEDRRGTPPGMTQADLDLRSDIARTLGTSAFPGTREDLVVTAAEHHAPDAVLRRLGSLPPGETFQNVQDVARALGLHVETRRT